jgi:hypothetical protein
MSLVNKILLGLVAVQLGLFFLVRGSNHTPSIAEAKPLLPGMAADKVTRVQIYGPSKSGTDKPEIDLVKKDGRWVLASHYDYPAKGDEVSALLGKLAAMESRGPLTTSPDRLAQLEVAKDNYQGKVVIEGGGKHTIWIGSSPKFRKLSVRIDDSNEVHAVSTITPDDLKTTLLTWADNVYMELDPKRMVALTVENANGTIALEKNADGSWSQVAAAGKTPGKAPAKTIELDQNKVNNIARKLERIELETVLGSKAEPAHGFDKPLARITVGLKGAADKPGAPAPEREVSIIEIGAKTGGRYALRALDKAHVVGVAQSNFSELVELSLDKLKKEEPKKGDKKKGAPGVTPGPPMKLPPGLKLPH